MTDTTDMVDVTPIVPVHDAQIALWAAQARQATAAATFAEAQAAAQHALARKTAAEAHVAETSADLIDVQRDIVERDRRVELAKDEYHRVFRFAAPVTASSVRQCMTMLTQWDRLEPECDIEIEWCSPGGEMVSGLALFDFIQEIRRRGHHVTTSALGMAASMAAILLQSGDHRVMARESWLLVHEVSFGASGSYGEIEDTVGWIERVQERVLAIFADRSQASECPEPLTVTQLKRKWKRTDWWLSSDDALRYGLVDTVR